MIQRIYLAALYSRLDEMAQYANRFKKEGHRVVASWVYGGEEGKTREDIALLDYEDVQRCSVLVLFTHPRGVLHSGGGRHVEFGMAYALGKHCFIVGDKEHVFCHLPGVIQFQTVDEVIRYLRVVDEDNYWVDWPNRIGKDDSSQVSGK